MSHPKVIHVSHKATEEDVRRIVARIQAGENVAQDPRSKEFGRYAGCKRGQRLSDCYEDSILSDDSLGGIGITTALYAGVPERERARTHGRKAVRGISRSTRRSINRRPSYDRLSLGRPWVAPRHSRLSNRYTRAEMSSLMGPYRLGAGGKRVSRDAGFCDTYCEGGETPMDCVAHHSEHSRDPVFLNRLLSDYGSTIDFDLPCNRRNDVESLKPHMKPKAQRKTGPTWEHERFCDAECTPGQTPAECVEWHRQYGYDVPRGLNLLTGADQRRPCPQPRRYL